MIDPANVSVDVRSLPEQGLVSYEALSMYGLGLFVASSTVCVFGMAANVINACVFVKQGTKDTVTITLLALAINDFLTTATMFGVAVCFNPLVRDHAAPTVRTFDVSYIIGWCHNGFSRISGALVAYITLERCICVTLPLKVKSIFTRGRTVVTIIIIHVIGFGSVGPVFYTSRLGWTFYSSLNYSVLGLVFPPDRAAVDAVSFVMNSMVFVPGVFIAIVVFTAILVVQLTKKSKWRQAASASGNEEKADSSGMSPKDRRVVRMVVFISCLTIFCYSPNVASTFTGVLVPEYNIGARETNLGYIIGTWCLFMQALNSSVNIFIYVNMSSRFRDILFGIFGKEKIDK